MRKTTVALALVSASFLAVPASATVSPGGQTKCKDDGHKYIYGKSATTHGRGAVFVGVAERFHPCGEDDGYFTHHGNKTISLTLTPATEITVFKNELDPSHTRMVTAAKFAHIFTKNKDEPFFRFSGPMSGVKKLSEHFVS